MAKVAPHSGESSGIPAEFGQQLLGNQTSVGVEMLYRRVTMLSDVDP